MIKNSALKFERKTDLSPNTLDIRRNCRHNHRLGLVRLYINSIGFAAVALWLTACGSLKLAPDVWVDGKYRTPAGFTKPQTRNRGDFSADSGTFTFDLTARSGPTV